MSHETYFLSVYVWSWAVAVIPGEHNILFLCCCQIYAIKAASESDCPPHLWNSSTHTHVIVLTHYNSAVTRPPLWCCCGLDVGQTTLRAAASPVLWSLGAVSHSYGLKPDIWTEFDAWQSWEGLKKGTLLWDGNCHCVHATGKLVCVNVTCEGKKCIWFWIFFFLSAL